MITKKSVTDSINVRESGFIEVRRADIISEDGKELSRIYHRHIVAKNADLSSEDKKVKAIALAAWEL